MGAVHSPPSLELGEPRHYALDWDSAGLCPCEQICERIEVTADSDPSFDARLKWNGAPTGERISNNVSRARETTDERVGKRRREATDV